MEVKKEWTQCRLCFLHVEDYINILESSSLSRIMNEALKSYFNDEVDGMDILPKIICHLCCDKVKEFHTFTKQVATLRQNYLQQYLNNCFKQEDVEDEQDFERAIDESQIHTESICVAPVTSIDYSDEIEEANEQHDFKSNELYCDEIGSAHSNIEETFQNDTENYEYGTNDEYINSKNGHEEYQSDNSDLNNDIVSGKSSEIFLLPRNFSEVNVVQKQQIINQYCNMNCDHCDVRFQDFEEISTHYKAMHSDKPEGYAKCCDRVFKVHKLFNDHILWHLNKAIWKCNICGLSYKSRQSYNVHQFNHRTNALNPFKCDICDKTFAKKSRIENHILAVHASKMQFQCVHCREGFKSEQDLEAHINVAHNDSYIDLVDDIHLALTAQDISRGLSEYFDMTCAEIDCTQIFDSLQHAQQHYLEAHGCDGFIRCCQKLFTRQRLVEEHIAWHNDKNIFRCIKCAKVFYTRLLLKRHVMVHEENGLYCKQCRLGFKKTRTYRAHMKKHMKQMFHCEHCDKRFSQQSNLIEHVKVIHEQEFEAQRKKEKDFKIMSKYFDLSCDWEGCDIMFDSLEMAKSHYSDCHQSDDYYIKCCDAKFREPNLVKDHLAWHQNPDIFKCLQCGESVQTRKILYYHTFKHKYPTTKNFICDICQKSFFSKFRLKSHIYECHINRPKKCMICAELFTTRKSLEEHLKTAHISSSVEFKKQLAALGKYLSKEQAKEIIDTYFDKKCDFCDTELDNFSDAQRHYLKEHKIRDGYLKCCSVKYKTSRTVLDHAHWHHDPNTFICFLCKKVFASRASLIKHITSTHESVQLVEKPFECNFCEKSYSNELLLKKHMDATHSEATQSHKQHFNSDPPNEASENVFLFDETNNDVDIKTPEIIKSDSVSIPDYFDMTCTLCTTIFTSLQDARDHYLQAHENRGGFVTCCKVKIKTMTEVEDHIEWHSNPDLFKCDICNISFQCRRVLTRHNFNHHKSYKFICKVCGRNLRRKCYLDRHMKKHDGTRERNFICETCNKGFYCEESLKGHIGRKHKTDQSHICEFCAKSFNTVAQLRAHLKRHDDTKKPKERFQCKECQKWLSSQGSLFSHMQRHNSEPQKCDQCDKVSPNIAALKMHVRAVHCESNFKCHICGKTFKLGPTLADHIATHQDKRVYKCSYCDETFTWRTNMYKHQKKNHYAKWLADKEKKDSKSTDSN